MSNTTNTTDNTNTDDANTLIDQDIQDILKNASSPEALDALVKAKSNPNEIVKASESDQLSVDMDIDEEDLDEPVNVPPSANIDHLNSVFLKLFRNEPFLGAISMAITKVGDTKQPTAYIGVRPNGKTQEVVMGFNPKFMDEQTEEKQLGVIKHELLHMIFQHIFTRSVGEKSYQLLWNWATDLAINSIIGKENLPEMCLLPGHTPVDPKTGKKVEGPYAEYIQNAPLMMASDYYFEGLRKIQEEQGDSDCDIAIGSGIGTMDGHDHWKDLPSDVQEQIRDKMREMVGKAAEKAQIDNSWGSVPHEIQDVIRKMLSREVDWRSVLRNFIGRTRTLQRTSTVRKVNKKTPYVQPGVRRPTIANFACFVDQSGSVGDNDLSLLFGELESLSSLTTLDVYHFDTEIDLKSHTVWKKGSPTPKPHRTRCGGTDFSAVSNFLNSKENRGKYSGAVILTDGYADTMPMVIGTKILWLITETGTMSAPRPGDLAVQLKKERQFKAY
jgi:predicted metal-dependent peptidase